MKAREMNAKAVVINAMKQPQNISCEGFSDESLICVKLVLSGFARFGGRGFRGVNADL